MHDNKVTHRYHLVYIAILSPNSNFNAYIDAFLNRHHKDFRVSKICQISNLKKSLIAGNHVYLNCSAFLALQTN